MTICSTCGNTLQGRVCRVCATMQTTRAKKWRRGDRGGKRPERTAATSPQTTTKRSLAQALNGTWRSLKRDVTITINTKTNTYRSSHPQKDGETYHRWRLGSENRRELTFFKDKLQIDVRVDDAGIVRMKAGQMELGFVYIFDSHELRTCPTCFAKTPVSIINCNECDWSFGITFVDRYADMNSRKPKNS